MRFQFHIQSSVKEQIRQLADNMKAWENVPRMDANEEEKVKENLTFFSHAKYRTNLIYSGVDGSGDFPAVTYGDVFVYITTAQGTSYVVDPVTGLKEIVTSVEPLIHFTLLPSDNEASKKALDETFSKLVGIPVQEVIEQSDYRKLKAIESKKGNSIEVLFEQLIRPHASDTGNIGIQLRSTGELATALHLIRQESKPNYVLVDTTLALPTVYLNTGSLFFEHVKRLCCVEACNRGIGFFAISKSHGLPAMELIEEIARTKLNEDKIAEHWYLRIPVKEIDGWELSLTNGRKVPPTGAMSYLVRFHRNVPVLRIDMDLQYWQEYIQGEDSDKTRENECRIFEDLDYACHDQRCYGYPYPIKAGHDRASLTEGERESFRKMIIDEAAKRGLNRKLFRNVSIDTGHE